MESSKYKCSAVYGPGSEAGCWDIQGGEIKTPSTDPGAYNPGLVGG